ncbi:ATP-binding protein [Desulfococcus sp.]|uniref:HAMP domain-containing sensor histidine kinase n=1 Tax=Desulfococcus sp. TaxID=2025834 RepID=UPI0035938182
MSTFNSVQGETVNRKEIISSTPYSISYALLKNNGSDPVAVLSTAINCENAERYRKETAHLFLISSIIAFALAAGIGVLTAKSFTRPIHKLLDATNRLASGRLDERVELEQPDEIGKLASAFNEMADRLEQKNHELTEALRVTEEYGRKIAETNSDLENLNADLERRVVLRTAELIKSNHDLEQTILALKEAKNQAEKANCTKSEFLSNMSHELRTPLNHIMGFTELVVGRDFGELNEIQEEYLKDVLTSSSHLLALINDILDIAKIESGKMELDLSEIAIRDVIQGSLTMVREKAMKKRCSLVYAENSLPETIHVDERKLKQVLYNLLSNAVKFTPPGGRIELRVETENRSWLCGNLPDAFREDVMNVVDGHARYFLHVALADTGIGIRPQSLKSIFDVFQQEDKTISGKFGGSGLGLSLCKQLVELHKGGIWVDSMPGEGSTFHFLLPFGAAGAEKALPDAGESAIGSDVPLSDPAARIMGMGCAGGL